MEFRCTQKTMLKVDFIWKLIETSFGLEIAFTALPCASPYARLCERENFNNRKNLWLSTKLYTFFQPTTSANVCRVKKCIFDHSKMANASVVLFSNQGNRIQVQHGNSKRTTVNKGTFLIEILAFVAIERARICARRLWIVTQEGIISNCNCFCQMFSHCLRADLWGAVERKTMSQTAISIKYTCARIPFQWIS